MRWLNFSVVIVLILFLFSPSDTKAESGISAEIEKEYNSKYDLRIDRYKKRWENFIPNLKTIQFAGSMGFLSVGTGWDYGKRNQWETHIFLGYLPKFSSNKANVTFTVKENYLPWSIHLKNKNFSVEPFHCGFYINTILNSQDFWVRQPERYPKGYYWFSSRMRFNLCVGQTFTYHIPNKKTNLNHSISFFYELETNDFHLISYATNKTIKLKEIFHLSLGIKSRLF